MSSFGHPNEQPATRPEPRLRAAHLAAIPPSPPPPAQVSQGDKVPDLSLTDQSGKQFSLSKLKGKPYVLYFYPADNTPGCTKEACAFRDAYSVFQKKGCEVIGVSGDSPESHREFAKSQRLPFTLLTDDGNKARKAWGIPSDFFGALAGRQTYVVDRDGVVQLIFNSQFDSERHVKEALAVLDKIGGGPKPLLGFLKF
eukprot:SM000050S16950  [mRNA]  locus=s50:48930:50114:+ [translate_table: standard]